MILKDELAKCATHVDNALEALLRGAVTPSKQLCDAMLYGTIGSGKKLRPWLVLESSRLLGAERENALQCAMAVECVHAYSLIHDDLPAMDDDDMRRGKPTTHIKFDEATAILAGDSLLTLAFELLSSDKTHKDAHIRTSLITALARAAGGAGMVGGQMLDISASSESFDLQKTIDMQGLKTGKLIEFSCAAGSILANSSPEDTARLTQYGHAIGLAFQVTDDLLDAEGCEEQTGKRAGKDKDKGKSTYIDFLGVEGARDKAKNLIEDAKSCLEPYGEEAEGLRQTADYILTRNN